MKNRMKEIRRKAGVSQYQLAYLTGLSQSAISYIERGVYIPTVDSAYKIAAVLGVRIDELFVPETRELPKPYNVQEDDSDGRTSEDHPPDQHTATADGGEEASKASGSDTRIHRRLKK